MGEKFCLDLKDVVYAVGTHCRSTGWRRRLAHLPLTNGPVASRSRSREVAKVEVDVLRRLLREVEAQRFAFSFAWG